MADTIIGDLRNPESVHANRSIKFIKDDEKMRATFRSSARTCLNVVDLDPAIHQIVTNMETMESRNLNQK